MTYIWRNVVTRKVIEVRAELCSVLTVVSK